MHCSPTMEETSDVVVKRMFDSIPVNGLMSSSDDNANLRGGLHVLRLIVCGDYDVLFLQNYKIKSETHHKMTLQTSLHLKREG